MDAKLASRPNPRSDGYHAGVRPRDAATLIIVRFDPDEVRVLMGTRHARHRFMPGKVVFPGGQVDRADYSQPHAGGLAPDVRSMLLKAVSSRPGKRRANALALAAIRETFEETGLLIGRPIEAGMRLPRATGWRQFLENGVVPDLDPLGFVARAITPPGLVRRFDTRFFIADSRAIAAATSPTSNELQSLSWLTLAEARACDLPTITHAVLDVIEARLPGIAKGQVAAPAPFFRFRHGRRIVDELSPVA